MTAATLTAVHAFTASAEDRRRCTCGKSRNTSVHGYDKNARAAAKTDPRITTDPAELAVLLTRAAALDALPTEEDEEEPVIVRAGEAGPFPTQEAPLAVVTLDGAESTVQAAPTSAGWSNPHARTAAVLPSQVRKAAKPAAARGRAVEPNTRALWVARELVAIILDSTDPAHAVIVRKLSAVIPNNRGGRTIRLTAAEAELLSGIGTEIETAVLDASLEVDGAGRLARSCVTMRARLAALWA